MSKHIERTLVLLKPDAVERGLMGKILARFEEAGFKVVGMKLTQPKEDEAGRHYDEDVAKRNGERVRNNCIEFLTSGPVLAIVIEGIQAVDNVRKICGTTEPKSAPPGTIRGDYSHINYGYCDDNDMVVKNIIHASGDLEYAKQEIAIWFKPEEILEYSSVHERHTR